MLSSITTTRSEGLPCHIATNEVLENQDSKGCIIILLSYQFPNIYLRKKQKCETGTQV